MSGLILIDTGPIVATLLQSDQHHRTCVDQLRALRVPLLTCSPVLTEAAWLLRKHPAAVRRLLASVDGRFLKLLPLTEVDLPAITTILARYGNLELQIADACLLHLARREAIQTIFTLDRRDFSVVRTARGKKLRLIP